MPKMTKKETALAESLRSSIRKIKSHSDKDIKTIHISKVDALMLESMRDKFDKDITGDIDYPGIRFIDDKIYIDDVELIL